MSNAAEQLFHAPQSSATLGAGYAQIHLKGRGHSGRGVRYRVLKPSELDANEVAASKTLEEGFTASEYSVETMRLGLAVMVLAYTETNAKDLPSARWTQSDRAMLDRQWDALFTTRDTNVLRRIFREEHGVNDDEFEAIMAGKVEVLAD